MRYFDLRASWDDQTKQARVAHGTLGVPLRSVFESVVAFLHWVEVQAENECRASSVEIVTLDINHMYNFELDSDVRNSGASAGGVGEGSRHQQLIAEAEDVFGVSSSSSSSKNSMDDGATTPHLENKASWLIPEEKHNARLSELLPRERVVLLCSDEGKGSASCFTQPHKYIGDSRAFTHNPWANVATADRLKPKLDAVIVAETKRRQRVRQQPPLPQQQHRQHRLFILQLVLTARLKEIMASICCTLFTCCFPPHPPGSIHDLVWPGRQPRECCNRRAGSGVGDVASVWLEQWDEDHRMDLNVLLLDWIDTSQESIALLQQIIAVNDQPPRW